MRDEGGRSTFQWGHVVIWLHASRRGLSGSNISGPICLALRVEREEGSVRRDVLGSALPSARHLFFGSVHGMICETGCVRCRRTSRCRKRALVYSRNGLALSMRRCDYAPSLPPSAPPPRLAGFYQISIAFKTCNNRPWCLSERFTSRIRSRHHCGSSSVSAPSWTENLRCVPRIGRVLVGVYFPFVSNHQRQAIMDRRGPTQ